MVICDGLVGTIAEQVLGHEAVDVVYVVPANKLSWWVSGFQGEDKLALVVFALFIEAMINEVERMDGKQDRHVGGKDS